MGDAASITVDTPSAICALDPFDAADWFSVDLIIDHNYHILMDKIGINPVFMLYSADGTEIAHSSEITQYSRDIFINIHNTDTYYLKFQSETPGFDSKGSYNFTVIDGGGSWVISNTSYFNGPDIYEWNNNIEDAYAINVETNYANGRVWEGDTDIFSVELLENHSYHIDCDKQSWSVYMELIDENDCSFASSEELAWRPFHRSILINIETNGTYYIVIKSEYTPNVSCIVGYDLYIYEYLGHNSSWPTQTDCPDDNGDDDGKDENPLGGVPGYTPMMVFILFSVKSICALAPMPPATINSAPLSCRNRGKYPG
jgi:hypothetical protein